MFSSTTFIPFLPHLISSFSSTSPLLPDTNRFSFPPKPSPNHALLFDSPPNMAPPPPLSHSMAANFVDQHNASASSFLVQAGKTGSKPVKKDRHSKICTAQGLRDRRVRLSIGIARKFFDLQDMLGFEKASETLEWLLNKSNKAIKEVHEVTTNTAAAAVTDNGSCCITAVGASSTCEAVSKRESPKKLRRISGLNVSVHMAKESRLKARARARERTRVKMNSKRSPRSDVVLDQNNQTCQKLEMATHDPTSFMVSKRKMKANNGIVGTYHQNDHVMVKDLICINTNNSMNSPQNWDFSSAIARSGFCAITNINPSAGLHRCRKLWEAEGNYCPN